MNEVTQIVWWWDPSSDTDIPRHHGIVWSTIDGSRSGRIRFPQDDCDPANPRDAAINAYLKQHLAEDLKTDVQPVHASLQMDEIDPATRLAVRGYPIVDVRFGNDIDLEVLGGVTAGVSSGGTWCKVVARDDLSPIARTALAQWAEQQIDYFIGGTAETWADAGWTDQGSDRWQIIARQRNDS